MYRNDVACMDEKAALLTLLITDRVFTRTGRKGSRKNATRAVRATRRFLVTPLLLSSSSFKAALGGFACLGFPGGLCTELSMISPVTETV